MFKLKKSLHILLVLAMVLVLAFSIVPVTGGAAESEAEPTATLEIVSSYPYIQAGSNRSHIRAGGCFCCRYRRIR